VIVRPTLRGPALRPSALAYDIKFRKQLRRRDAEPRQRPCFAPGKGLDQLQDGRIVLRGKPGETARGGENVEFGVDRQWRRRSERAHAMGCFNDPHPASDMKMQPHGPTQRAGQHDHVRPRDARQAPNPWRVALAQRKRGRHVRPVHPIGEAAANVTALDKRCEQASQGAFGQARPQMRRVKAACSMGAKEFEHIKRPMHGPGPLERTARAHLPHSANTTWWRRFVFTLRPELAGHKLADQESIRVRPGSGQNPGFGPDLARPTAQEIGKGVEMNRKLIAAFAGLLLAAPAHAQDVSFEGKTIRVLINFPAGGSTDILMRSLAPAIAAKIPGAPTLVVENRPGAGGLTGANYFFNQVAPDGLTIGFLTGIGTSGLLGLPRVKFDPTKLRWLAALPQTQVMVARADLGIKQPRDIAKPAIQIVHAITGPNSSATALTTLFYGMVNAPHRFISGYRGQADTVLALQRGEVNAADMGITIYLARGDEIGGGKEISAVFQRGVLNEAGQLVRHRLLPDIPTAVEAIREIDPEKLNSTQFKAYRTVVGTFNVQFGFTLPPGTDEKIVASLRKAILAALDSDEARAAVKKSAGFDYDFIDGKEAEATLASLRDDLEKNPEVKKLLLDLMATK